MQILRALGPPIHRWMGGRERAAPWEQPAASQGAREQQRPCTQRREQAWSLQHVFLSGYESPCQARGRAPGDERGGDVREVEVKYRVRGGEPLLVVLKARGVELGEPVRQDDQAYAPQGWRFGDGKLGVSFLRLRTVNGRRHYFAVKQPTVNAMSCLEHETQIADREQMHQAIGLMGFEPTVRVVKTRRTATLGDDTALCLDEVEGVGTFLELERMVPSHVAAERVQAELAALVADWGVQVERTEETYDSLVRAVRV